MVLHRISAPGPVAQGFYKRRSRLPPLAKGPLSEVRAGDCHRQTTFYLRFSGKAVPANQSPPASPEPLFKGARPPVGGTEDEPCEAGPHKRRSRLPPLAKGVAERSEGGGLSSADYLLFEIFRRGSTSRSIPTASRSPFSKGPGRLWAGRGMSPAKQGHTSGAAACPL